MNKKQFFKRINYIILVSLFCHVFSLMYYPPQTYNPPLFIKEAFAAVTQDKPFADIYNALPNTEYRSNNVVVDTETSVSVAGDLQATIIKNLSNTGQSSVAGLVKGDLISIWTKTPSTVSPSKTITLTLGSKHLVWNITTTDPPAPLTQTGAISGYTLGNAGVSPSGAAEYSIPISAVPGTNGLSPKLSLEYSSQNSIGIVGIGWTLAGLSTITRCPQTIAQDGITNGVDFDGNDKFCLDGERLLPVDGTPNEYRTSIETFSKITSSGDQGGAPLQFTVKTKSGLTMEYGSDQYSRTELNGQTQIFSWAVRKISDSTGNYMLVLYNKDIQNGFIYPKEIDYAANDTAHTGAPEYVKFDYEDAPYMDKASAYINGSMIKINKRLTAISTGTSTSTNPLRKYILKYDNDASTQHSHLTSVQECGSDGTTCFAPTTFNWNAITSDNYNFKGFGSGLWTTFSGDQNASNVVTVDMNGDGKTDIVKFINESATARWMVCLSTGYGFNCQKWAGPDGDLSNTVFADVNGDGYTDMVKYANSQASNGIDKWRIFMGTGQNMVDTGLWVGHSGGNTNNIMADFNGDGRMDMAGYRGDVDGDGKLDNKWDVKLSTINMKITPSTTPNPTVTSNFGATSGTNWIAHDGGITNTMVGDFNGDGMADLGKNDGDYNWKICLSTGSNTVDGGFHCNTWVGPKSDIKTNTFLGDYNGDGKTDLLAHATNNLWELCYSTGVSFTCSQVPAHNGTEADNITGDFNGDGKTDIAAWAEDNQQWLVCLARNNGFSCDQYWNGHTGKNTNNILGDFNGDGKTDLAGYTGLNYQWDVALAGGLKPDLIESVTEGKTSDSDIQGKTTKFVYQTLTNSDTNIDPNTNTPNKVYDKDTDALYPRMDMQGSMYVVKQMGSSNGKGGFNTIDYTYAGAVLNLEGRGFRGFHRVWIKDNAHNTNTLTEYDTGYKNAHLVLNQQIRVASTGRLITETNNTLVSQDNISGKASGTFFPYVSKSIVKKYNPDNPTTDQLISTITTDHIYDSHGNETSTVITYGDGTEITTTNEYASDNESNWFLGRLTKSTVLNQRPNQTDITKMSVFAYDPNTGQLTQEITESGNALQLTKTYTRDVFGNITQSTVTSGSDSRTTNTTYDSKGRFVTQLTNPLGHITTPVYDQLSGLLLSSTDPNNLTTTYAYDPFGRAISTTDPVRTVSKTAYLKNYTGVGCTGDTIHLTYSQSSGGSPKITCYDILDREVRNITTGFDGTKVYVDTVYDAIGRVSQKSDPYFAGAQTINWTTYEYDAMNRVSKETKPGSRTTTYKYDAYTTTVTNSKSQTLTTTVNVRNKPVASIDAYGKTITYNYDSADNLIEVKDPNANSTTMTYNIMGNRTSITDPDTGTTNTIYDAFGEPISETDAKGETITKTYDKLGRVIKSIEAEGTTTYTYDTRSYAKGKLATISRSDGYRKQFIYDANSRPSEVIQKIEGTYYSTSNTYDQYSRLLTLTYPTAFTTKNVYNASSYLSEIRHNSDNALYWIGNTANALGMLTQETYGNSVETSFTYDSIKNFLTGIQSGLDASPTAVQNIAYTYDSLGNIVTRTDKNINRKETLSNDKLNRLVKADVTNNIDNSSISSVTVAYNALGNITNKSDVGTYSYSSSRPHAVTAISGTQTGSFTYDQTGNRIGGLNGESIIYNSFNLPSTIIEGTTTIQNSYSPEHDKIVSNKTLNGTTTKTVYIDGIYEKETSGQTTKNTHYINSPAGLIAIYTDSGSTQSLQYVHADHQGTVSTITDGSGAIVETLSFDPWGNRRDATTWTPSSNISSVTTKGYTGHEQLDSVGLIDMKGRIYDPVIARFLSADPYVQSPQFTQSLNRYSYVLNNPLNLTDPSGFFSISDLFDPFVDAAHAVGDFLSDNKILVFSVAVGFATGWGLATLLTSEGAIFAGSATAAIISSGAGFGFGASFTSTVLSGGSFGSALLSGLKNGAIGGLEAAASAGIGVEFNHTTDFSNLPEHIEHSIAHGVLGGAISELQGGKFEHGFISAAGAEFMTPIFSQIKGFDYEIGARTAVAAAIGGTLSELSGGSFANGAITAAFQHLYNDEGENLKRSLGAFFGGAARGTLATNSLDTNLLIVANQDDTVISAQSTLAGTGLGFGVGRGLMGGFFYGTNDEFLSSKSLNIDSPIGGISYYYNDDRFFIGFALAGPSLGGGVVLNGQPSEAHIQTNIPLRKYRDYFINKIIQKLQ